MTAPSVIEARHEPSAWLRDVTARAYQYLQREGIDPRQWQAVVMAVHDSEPGSREDFTCDRCRQFVPDGVLTAFTYGPLRDGLVIVGGLCDGCWGREMGGRP